MAWFCAWFGVADLAIKIGLRFEISPGGKKGTSMAMFYGCNGLKCGGRLHWFLMAWPRFAFIVGASG